MNRPYPETSGEGRFPLIGIKKPQTIVCGFESSGAKALAGSGLFSLGLGLVDGKFRTKRKRDSELFVGGKARTSWNQVPHDDVLLEATEEIDFSESRRIGKNPGRFLEGRCRDEAFGFKRGLRDTQENGFRFGRLSTRFFDTFVFCEEGRAIDLLTPEILRIARIGDPNFPKHLADDDLDMLVVDRHALEAIDLLHLRDQEIIERRGPKDLKNRRGDRPHLQ